MTTTRSTFWDLTKCLLGFHALNPSINAKWDQCTKCWKLFKVV